MSENRSRLPARLIIATVSLFVLLLVIHLAGIALTRYAAEKTLHPALPQGTYIGEVHLNLLSGVMEIEDFRLQNDGTLWMRAGRMGLDISPWRLLLGQVHVEALRIENAYARVVRRPDGGFDLGLPPFGADEPVEADAAPLPFSIGQLVLERFALDYHDGDLNSVVYADSIEVGAHSLGVMQQRTPVTWRLRWDGRRLSGDAVVDIDGDAITVQGRLQTELLDLGLAQRLARLPASASGELAYSGDFAWQDSRLNLNGALQSPSLAYAADDLRATLKAGELPEFELALTTGPAMVIDLALAQPLRVGEFDWQSAGQHAQLRDLLFSGRLAVRPGADLALSASALAADRLVWGDAGRALEIAALALSGELQQPLSGGLPVVAGDATIGRLAYRDTPAGVALTSAGARVESLRLGADDDPAGQQRLSGNLHLADSELRSGDTTLALGTAALSTDGSLTAAGPHLAGDLDLGALRVEHPRLAQALTLRRLVSKGLELGEQTRFGELRLSGLALPSASRETALTVGSIQLAKVSYAPKAGVAIGQIVIDALQTGVIRDRAGRWRHALSPAGKPSTAAARPAQKADAAAAPLRWRIGGIRVTGDSHVTTADYLNPDISKPRFAIERFKIGALSTAAPNANTPIAVTLRPDQYSEFVLDGDMRPLADDFYIVAKGHLQGFGLSTVNGLIANDLGHRFGRGQIDDEFDIRIENNHLSMRNTLHLSEVEVEAIDGKDGPPLGTAVALLEDRDGNIKLDVPVDGDLSDPSFRVLGALNPILMKAVVGTAALAIQPLGSVLLVGSLAADKALKVTFDPALFAPGSAELDDAARDYLRQLAGKLVEKPKLAVRLCGVIADGERKKDKKGDYLDKEPALLQLAQRRADRVRDFLREQGVGKHQLRACRPALDKPGDAAPRVDIKF